MFVIKSLRHLMVLLHSSSLARRVCGFCLLKLEAVNVLSYADTVARSTQYEQLSEGASGYTGGLLGHHYIGWDWGS